MASRNVTTTYIKEVKQTWSPSATPPVATPAVTVSDTYLVIQPSATG